MLLAVCRAGFVPSGVPVAALAGGPSAVDAGVAAGGGGGGSAGVELGGSAGIEVGGPSTGVEDAPVTCGGKVGEAGVVGVVDVAAGPGVTAQFEANVAGESGVAAG